MISRLGIAAAALVMGCQGTPAEKQWTGKDATPEDVKRALYWCTTRIEHRRHDQTPAMERRTRDVVDEECMEKRGFSKAE